MLIRIVKDIAGLVSGVECEVTRDLAERWIETGHAVAVDAERTRFADSRHDDRRVKASAMERKVDR